MRKSERLTERAIRSSKPRASVRARAGRQTGGANQLRPASRQSSGESRAQQAIKTTPTMRGHLAENSLGCGHKVSVTHLGIATAASIGRDHTPADIQKPCVASASIDEIREQWKRRQMWHRAEKSLTLQAKSMCRRLLAGDKKEAEVLYKSALNGKDHELAETAYLAMLPLLDARDGIEKSRKTVEKRLLALAKGLPIVGWVEQQRGVGLLSLAGIIGEAGDLSTYSNPAKLWKRMGLAVIGGERQRKKEGAAGIEHGYNPSRRSLVWTIGDCIIKAGGPLKELYNERKAYEMPRVKTKMHAHNRAKRYIEKRLLRDMWRAWRDARD